MDDARGYTGWKATVLVIATIVAVTALVHTLARRVEHRQRTPPGKVVTTVTPSS